MGADRPDENTTLGFSFPLVMCPHMILQGLSSKFATLLSKLSDLVQSASSSPQALWPRVLTFQLPVSFSDLGLEQACGVHCKQVRFVPLTMQLRTSRRSPAGASRSRHTGRWLDAPGETCPGCHYFTGHREAMLVVCPRPHRLQNVMPSSCSPVTQTRTIFQRGSPVQNDGFRSHMQPWQAITCRLCKQTSQQQQQQQRQQRVGLHLC